MRHSVLLTPHKTKIIQQLTVPKAWDSVQENAVWEPGMREEGKNTTYGVGGNLCGHSVGQGSGTYIEASYLSRRKKTPVSKPLTEGVRNQVFRGLRALKTT